MRRWGGERGQEQRRKLAQGTFPTLFYNCCWPGAHSCFLSSLHFALQYWELLLPWGCEWWPWLDPSWSLWTLMEIKAAKQTHLAPHMALWRALEHILLTNMLNIPRRKHRQGKSNRTSWHLGVLLPLQSKWPWSNKASLGKKIKEGAVQKCIMLR